MRVHEIEIHEEPENSRCFIWLIGSKDGWSIQERLCDVYEVSGYLVAVGCMSNRPMFVVRDREELLRMARTITGIK